jgi:hypothetical protein
VGLELRDKGMAPKLLCLCLSVFRKNPPLLLIDPVRNKRGINKSRGGINKVEKENRR